MKTHNHGVTFSDNSDNDTFGINNPASGGANMSSGKGVGDTGFSI